MWLVAFGLAIALSSAQARAATTAGTVISNTATLSFDIAGMRHTVFSNTASLIIAETLDVSVDTDAPSGPVPEREECAVGFVVANHGSGTETFDLTAQAEGPGASVVHIAGDTDGSRVYNAAIDKPLANSQLTLASGASAHVFAVVGGDCAKAGSVRLRALARTGSGVPGTVFPGQGDGGGDAIVGKTGADKNGTVTGTKLRLLAKSVEPSLTKSQSVETSDGSDTASAGAIVTYRLVAAFPRTTADVEIEDPIPAGTAYVPGSLTLDGATLSDAGDDDPGRADDSSILVGLGEVAPGTRTIVFKVRIL
ncbi:hypothetical protein [Novosphingobium sp. JCM 18896]|uniref:hypothetical protein n=1 Tax=Novosphingobium sp. JCM 18896 TaxID=2989731 RepID=UPI002222964D|nr:hypothetical protein [Novosphingobium sp. JCM 18896]MCW1430756.1 hypothetical protein [Novosphingobium sp. JCM 18896]